MPDLIPEKLYNWVPAKLGDRLGGGIMWNANYDSSTYRYDENINIKNIFEITPDQLSPLSNTIHIDVVSGLKFKLFSWPNDCDMYVSVWVTEAIGGFPQGSYDVWAVNVTGCIKHGNDYYYPWGYGPQGYNFNAVQNAGGIAIGASGRIFCCPMNIVKQYGIKFEILADYSYGKGEAQLDITKCSMVEVKCFLPGQDSEHPAGFQSFSHITEGLRFFHLNTGDQYEDWESNPQYVYFGYTWNMVTTTQNVFATDDLTSFANALNNLSPLTGPIFEDGTADDPNQETDPSGTGGGGGNMDPSSDPIPFPDLPVGGALLSGAIKAYEVDATILTQMFIKLWDTSIFDIATFQKLVEAPLDSLIQLQCVPMDPHTSGTGHVMLGNFDTEAVAPKIDQEYYTIDCGTLTVEEYWGSALDYSPYTSAEIWVPMVGFRDLDINDIMGKTIHLKYNYSIFDGNLTAQLMCGNAVLYKWPGNVRETIPVTARVNDALQRLVTGAMGVATAGTGAGMAAAAIGAAVNVAMAKTHVSRTGEMGGSTGLLDDFMPFLIIHRPIQSLAAGFKTQKGYPSNISAVLSSCQGYTEVEYVHLTGIDMATDTELQEIEQLLKSGVII